MRWFAIVVLALVISQLEALPYSRKEVLEALRDLEEYARGKGSKGASRGKSNEKPSSHGSGGRSKVKSQENLGDAAWDGDNVMNPDVDTAGDIITDVDFDGYDHDADWSEFLYNLAEKLCRTGDRIKVMLGEPVHDGTGDQNIQGETDWTGGDFSDWGDGPGGQNGETGGDDIDWGDGPGGQNGETGGDDIDWGMIDGVTNDGDQNLPGPPDSGKSGGYAWGHSKSNNGVGIGVGGTPPGQNNKQRNIFHEKRRVSDSAKYPLN